MPLGTVLYSARDSDGQRQCRDKQKYQQRNGETISIDNGKMRTDAQTNWQRHEQTET